MKNATKLIALFALLAVAACGQTILSSTTLGAALSASATTVTLASTSTMLSQGAGNQVNTCIYVDKELLAVLTVTDSTHVVVSRNNHCGATGQGARSVAHPNGAVVYFSITSGNTAAPSFFGGATQLNGEVSGSCTATNLMFLPLIYPASGNRYDCMGVTTAGQWTLVSSRGGMPTLGATYTVPAGAIVPPGMIFLTDTGTAAATSITVPHGWGIGVCLTIIPGGAFTWTTAGNIRAAGTAVAGKATFFCWDGSKWDANI